jgi:DNA polymerase-4
MDAFFASVEQRDDPTLKGVPVAVGGKDRRGVVAAASYEARKFGVHSAMPGFKARMKCPSLVFVPPRMEVYRAVSLQIREIFHEYTDLVEPLSLDEAYLDVTDNKPGIASATQIASEIKKKIRERTGLTGSAGVSYNKFLAKLASDQDKPDGLFVITPKLGPDFVLDLPVGRFHGIGPVTEANMNQMGIFTGRDMRTKDLDFLTRRFGKHGPYYHAICRGIDDRPVTPDRVRKSVGAESTFGENVSDVDDVIGRMAPVVDKAWTRSQSVGLRGRTVVLKVKYADFEQVTRSRSLPSSIDQRDELMSVAVDLLRSMAPFPKGIRLIGVTQSGLGDGDEVPQLSLAL